MTADPKSVAAEHALVQGVRSTVAAASSMDSVAAGQQAVARIHGIERINTPDLAEAVVELVKHVKVAATAFKAKVDTIGHPLKAASDALRAQTKPTLDAFATAEAAGKRLIGEWREAERQRVQAEQRRVLEAALESGDEDGPPPAVDYIPDAPNRIAAGSASAHGMRVLIVEAVNLHDIATFDPSLLTLNAAGARDAVRERIKNGGADEPGIGRDRSITFNGIRAWYEERIAVR